MRSDSRERRAGRRCFALLAALAAGALVAPAQASNLIDRDVTRVNHLIVKKGGIAHLIYTKDGARKHVVAWNAVNARFPRRAGRQTEFRINFNQGWRTPHYEPDHAALLRSNTCGRYRGPSLPWLVKACTANDGSHWAVQSWQRTIPDRGRQDPGGLAGTELRLSHWAGPLPELTVRTDWTRPPADRTGSLGDAEAWDHLYGRLTYLGRPMFGFGTTSYGAPTDTWGVLLYLDTFNSNWGKGWKRVEGFVTHNPTGVFCYTLRETATRPAGDGSRYRITAVGPGVLPDIVWLGSSPGRYDKARDEAANLDQKQNFSDKACRPG
ncbi:MAG: hypothetical protein ABR521_08785 [Gaiellaceae bacterium]